MSTIIISDDEETVDRWRGVDTVDFDDDSFEKLSYNDRARFSGSRSGSRHSNSRPTSSTAPTSISWTRIVDDDTVLTDDSHFVKVPRSVKHASRGPGGPSTTPSSFRTKSQNSTDVIVDIIGGKHVGKTAIFVKETEKRVGVAFSDSSLSIRYLKREHIRFRNDTRPKPMPGYSPRQVPSPGTASGRIGALQSLPLFEPGAILSITGGKYKGQTVTFVSNSDHRVAVSFRDGRLRSIDLQDISLRGKVQTYPRSQVAAIESQRDSRSNSRATVSVSCKVSERVKAKGRESLPRNYNRSSFSPSSPGMNYNTLVDVVGGTHAGKVARLVKHTNERVCVVFNEDFGSVRYLKPSNVRIRHVAP